MGIEEEEEGEEGEDGKRKRKKLNANDDENDTNERKRQRLRNLKQEKIVLLQSQSRIEVEQLEDLVLTGVEGAKKIGQLLKSKLRKHSITLLRQRQALDVNFDSSILTR